MFSWSLINVQQAGRLHTLCMEIIACLQKHVHSREEEGGDRGGGSNETAETEDGVVDFSCVIKFFHQNEKCA